MDRLLVHTNQTRRLTSSQKVQDYDFEKFPIDLKAYQPIPLDPVKDKKLSPEQKEALTKNIALLRDVIVFFTATGSARGVAGHTGYACGSTFYEEKR
jgi:hypothetical protein